MTRVIVSALIVVILTSTVYAAQKLPQNRETEEIITLERQICVDAAGEEHVLRLHYRGILLDRRVFWLEDERRGEDKPRVLWVAYRKAAITAGGLPDPAYAWKARIMHKEKDQKILLLMKTAMQAHLWFWVYEIDLSQDFGTPAQVRSPQPADWPEPTHEPYAVLETVSAKADINDIQAAEVEGSLVICCEHLNVRPGTLPPAYYRLDLKTKKWERLDCTGAEPEKIWRTRSLEVDFRELTSNPYVWTVPKPAEEQPKQQEQ